MIRGNASSRPGGHRPPQGVVMTDESLNPTPSGPAPPGDEALPNGPHPSRTTAGRGAPRHPGARPAGPRAPPPPQPPPPPRAGGGGGAAAPGGPRPGGGGPPPPAAPPPPSPPAPRRVRPPPCRGTARRRRPGRR